MPGHWSRRRCPVASAGGAGGPRRDVADRRCAHIWAHLRAVSMLGRLDREGGLLTLKRRGWRQGEGRLRGSRGAHPFDDRGQGARSAGTVAGEVVHLRMVASAERSRC